MARFCWAQIPAVAWYFSVRQFCIWEVPVILGLLPHMLVVLEQAHILKASVLAELAVPDGLFILPLFIQTGPRGLSTSPAREACPCSLASTWRRATGPCPPSSSPRSCRPTTSGRGVTGRPTRRNPFRSCVVGFPLWRVPLINCF